MKGQLYNKLIAVILGVISSIAVGVAMPLLPDRIVPIAVVLIGSFTMFLLAAYLIIECIELAVEYLKEKD